VLLRPSSPCRLLVAACEALGFAAGGAALHVDDLPVAECQDLEALVASSIRFQPLGRADDLVGADLGELRLNLDPALAPLLDLERQDLTGLLGAVSGGRSLPPEMAVRDATPLVLLSDQRRERLGITPIQRFGCSAKLIDHPSSMPGKPSPTRSTPTARVNARDVEPGAAQRTICNVRMPRQPCSRPASCQTSPERPNVWRNPRCSSVASIAEGGCANVRNSLPRSLNAKFWVATARREMTLRGG
jgi:hypothetical protein